MTDFTQIILMSNFFFSVFLFFFNKKNWIFKIFFINNTYFVYIHDLLTSYNNFSFFLFLILIMIFSIEIIVILIFFFNKKKNI